MMHYPTPCESEKFQRWIDQQKYEKFDADHVYQWEYSRDNCSEQMQEYISWVNKRSRVFRWIPGIEAVYLCNSLTFNALHHNSDIDVCIITTPHRLWTARLYSRCFLTLLWLRRWRQSGIRKKICLSFYIDQQCQNLYSLSCADDVYLIYWLAHLVPLYERSNWSSTSMRHFNRWIYTYIPNLERWQNIFLWVTIQRGTVRIRRWLEYWMHGRVWRVGELLVRIVWMPIVLLKKWFLWPKWRSQIISFSMLKFHNCIRAKIAYMWKKYRNRFS